MSASLNLPLTKDELKQPFNYFSQLDIQPNPLGINAPYVISILKFKLPASYSCYIDFVKWGIADGYPPNKNNIHQGPQIFLFGETIDLLIGGNSMFSFGDLDKTQPPVNPNYTTAVRTSQYASERLVFESDQIMYAPPNSNVDLQLQVKNQFFTAVAIYAQISGYYIYEKTRR